MRRASRSDQCILAILVGEALSLSGETVGRHYEILTMHLGHHLVGSTMKKHVIFTFFFFARMKKINNSSFLCFATK